MERRCEKLDGGLLALSHASVDMQLWKLAGVGEGGGWV